ncbi:MAG: DUF58 domain-containing protein [Dissulfurispiraceae bacterium]|jgi:uncharacterized protein (DUF58 family)|nr:DUF58 domain-containing protein [Dissulfurispiraceae bacterium]
MAVSGFFGRYNLRMIDVQLEPPAEIYAMSHAVLRLKIQNNKKHFPAFLLRVKVMCGEALVAYLDSSGEGSAAVSVVFEKRGMQTTGSIRICSVFPFNFFVRCIQIPDKEPLLVLPELRKCSLTQPAQQGRQHAEGLLSDSRGYESGIISLRPYQAGDPLRHIHWKAAAKTDKLLTKEFPSSRAEPVLINFDELDIPDIETKISCTAYALNRLIRQGTPAGLVIEKKVLKPSLGSGHRLKMLEKLALYGN